VWNCPALPIAPYAKVEGDQIIYAGRAVSPNQLAQHVGRSTRNAWHDLFIRRPGDKTFKQACVLRSEVEREKQELHQARLAAAGPAVAAPAASSDLSTQALAVIVTSVLAQMTPSRDTTAGPGWNLPERRQHRYRLEDIAFE